MARLTVEDCLQEIPNRFQLVLDAAKRATQIAKGAEPVVERENDKPTVLALREIAEGYIDIAAKVEAEARAEAAAAEAAAITGQVRDESNDPTEQVE